MDSQHANPIRRHERGVTITLQVQPRASRTEVAGVSKDTLRLRVAAPPVDGAANAEVIDWLRKQLRVAKRDVTILSGERGRRKVVLVESVTVDDVKRGLGLA